MIWFREFLFSIMISGLMAASFLWLFSVMSLSPEYEFQIGLILFLYAFAWYWLGLFVGLVYAVWIHRRKVNPLTE